MAAPRSVTDDYRMGNFLLWNVPKSPLLRHRQSVYDLEQLELAESAEKIAHENLNKCVDFEQKIASLYEDVISWKKFAQIALQEAQAKVICCHKESQYQKSRLYLDGPLNADIFKTHDLFLQKLNTILDDLKQMLATTDRSTYNELLQWQDVASTDEDKLLLTKIQDNETRNFIKSNFIEKQIKKMQRKYCQDVESTQDMESHQLEKVRVLNRKMMDDAFHLDDSVSSLAQQVALNAEQKCRFIFKCRNQIRAQLVSNYVKLATPLENSYMKDLFQV